MPHSGTPEEQRAKRRAYRIKHGESRRAYYRARYQRTKEEHRVKRRARYQRDRASILVKTKTYRDTHPEIMAAIRARSYATNQDKIIARSRAYRVKNREATNQAARIYRKTHPEVSLAAYKRKRAAKANAPLNDLTHAQWLEIQAAQAHCCAYCGRRAKGHLTQDHITPLSQGGSHTLANVIGACRPCNSQKHTGPPIQPVQPLLLTVNKPKKTRI